MLSREVSIAARPLAPARMRPDVSAPAATSAAHETWLDVAQPDIIGPLVGEHFDRMAASEVRTIDQRGCNAGLSHFGEGDLLWPLHAP
jgi:hypothetical protein